MTNILEEFKYDNVVLPEGGPTLSEIIDISNGEGSFFLLDEAVDNVWSASETGHANDFTFPFSGMDPLNGSNVNPDMSVTWEGATEVENNTVVDPSTGEVEREFTLEVSGGNGTFAIAGGPNAQVLDLSIVDDRTQVIKQDINGNPFEFQNAHAFGFEGTIGYANGMSSTIMGGIEKSEDIKAMFGNITEYALEVMLELEGSSFGGVNAPHLNTEWSIEAEFAVEAEWSDFGGWIVTVTAEFAGEVKTETGDFKVEPEDYEAIFTVADLAELDFAMPAMMEQSFQQMQNALGPVWQSVEHFEDYISHVLADMRDAPFDEYYGSYNPLDNPFQDQIPMLKGDDIAFI